MCRFWRQPPSIQTLQVKWRGLLFSAHGEPVLHVADTNLLLHSTPRRYLLGVAAYRDEPVLLTPTVALELELNLPEVEYQAWKRRAKEIDANAPDHLVERLQDAAGMASASWLRHELARPDGPLRRMDRSDGSFVREARAIRRHLPDAAFAVRGTEAVPTGDERVVSEAIAYGADLLLTNNVQSMNHHVVNEWATREHGYNHPFLCDGDSGLGLVLGEDFQRKAHWVACCMSVSLEARSEASQTESFHRFAANLRQTFPRSACAMHVCEAQADGVATRRHAREAIASERMWAKVRDCDMRRVKAVREAAAALGWEPRNRSGLRAGIGH